MNINKLFISLLRFTVCGVEVDQNLIKELDEISLKNLYFLSKKHDLAHIVSKALCDSGFVFNDKIGSKFSEEQMMSIFRSERMKYELNSISKTLEKAKINHLPLKGSIIRNYYPEPWMRTSCDIDVLVKKSDLKSAIKELEDNLKYEFKEKSPHDVSLFSPSGMHLELHHRLIEDKDSESFEKTLAKVFDYTEIAEGFKYKLNMTNDMFYYFHIAHMAKHFISGGCGVKPFLDLWVLENKAGYIFEDSVELLKKGGLLKFAQSARKLAQVWFSGDKEDDVSNLMEEYILNGGVYGNSNNRLSVSQSKRRGKTRHILRKIFLPYKTIKLYYPILEKHKWLLVFCEVHRWLRLIFCGGIKKSVNEVVLTKNINDEQVDKASLLLKNIGL